MTTKQCPQCGTEFIGRANKVYCSTKCKMDAFYSSNENIINRFEDFAETDNKALDTKETDKQNMVIVPVPFTIEEKELLEYAAKDCKTVLPKLVRIRSLMDETDIKTFQQTIQEQKQEIEELRIRIGFYQGNANGFETDKRFNKNGLFIKLSNHQLKFLTEKYLESLDFDSPDSGEFLPDGSSTSNEREALEFHEQDKPGYILTRMENAMFCGFISNIEENLMEHCGYTEEEIMENPLADEFN